MMIASQSYRGGRQSVQSSTAIPATSPECGGAPLLNVTNDPPLP